jgi:DNA gyrase subunit A
MVITRNGVVNRQNVDEISLIGRATQGVKLVNLDEGDSVVDVARVVVEYENGEENGEADHDDVESATEASVTEGGEAD